LGINKSHFSIKFSTKFLNIVRNIRTDLLVLGLVVTELMHKFTLGGL
jgi:hypothetical protein